MKKQKTIAERKENIAKEEALIAVIESFVDALETHANYSFRTPVENEETGECVVGEDGRYIYTTYPYSDNEWEKVRYYKSVYADKIIEFINTLEVCDVD